jgi:hypothetical protein
MQQRAFARRPLPAQRPMSKRTPALTAKASVPQIESILHGYKPIEQGLIVICDFRPVAVKGALQLCGQLTL